MILSLRNGTPVILPTPITEQQQVLQNVLQFYQITLGHALEHKDLGYILCL